MRDARSASLVPITRDDVGKQLEAKGIDPALEWRAALVRLPQRKPVLFTSKLKARASASALDDAAWAEVVRALAPIFEREDAPRGGADAES